MSAACAGGKGGIESNLGRMIVFREDHASSSSSTTLFSELAMKGCCGVNTAGRQSSDTLSKGHRRKFIHSLGYVWFLECVLHQIYSIGLPCTLASSLLLYKPHGLTVFFDFFCRCNYKPVNGALYHILSP